MKKRYLLLSFIIILMSFILLGCQRNEEVSKIDLFETQKALEISKEYLEYVKSGDMNSALALCSQELIDNTKDLSMGISEITSYNIDKWIDGKDFTYFLFNVIRTSTLEPKSDLETYTIKVEKIEDQYVITLVKAESKKELYVRNKALRIIEEQGANSNLVVNLNSLPKDTYISTNEMMLFKDKVPNDEFGKVALSFSGKKIAISTKSNNDLFICIANIEESLPAMAIDENSESNISDSTDTSSQLEELFEKPVANKIIGVDILENCSINNYIFSQKEGALVVNYKNSSGTNTFNIYDAEKGDIISKPIAEMFSTNKYALQGDEFDDDELLFTVISLKDASDEVQGKYSFNVETEEVTKL